MPPGGSGGGGFPSFMMGQQKAKGEALKEYVRGIFTRKYALKLLGVVSRCHDRC